MFNRRGTHSFEGQHRVARGALVACVAAPPPNPSTSVPNRAVSPSHSMGVSHV